MSEHGNLVDDPTGADVRVEGSGPTILIVHPGMDDGRSWAKVAGELTAAHTVARFTRRQYRPSARRPMSIADEAEDVVSIAAGLSAPVLLVGHSSGAVVALEALVRSPHLFSGAVLYEPPLETELPSPYAAIDRALDALANDRPGRAMQLFVRDMVGLLPAFGLVVRAMVPLVPRMRRLGPWQIFDAKSIAELGDRLSVYAAIPVPVLLVGGSRSPAHLGRRLDALAAVLPRSSRVEIEGQGHSANARDPRGMARLIADFAASGLDPDGRTLR